jgi:hypothetical protein
VALPVSSIEAIYYGAIARDAVAARQADTLGRQKAELITAAVTNALNELQRSNTKAHLISRRGERVVRNKVLEQLPSADGLSDTEEIIIRVPSPLAPEAAEYDRLLATENLDGILGRYPARESGALNAIATGLRFANRKDYEEAFLTAVTNDDTMKEQLREFLYPLDTLLTD